MRIPEKIDNLVLEDPTVRREYKLWSELSAAGTNAMRPWGGHKTDGPPVASAAQRKSLSEMLFFILGAGLAVALTILLGPWALVAAPLLACGVPIIGNRLTLSRRQEQEQKAKGHYYTVRRRAQVQLVAQRAAENELETLQTGTYRYFTEVDELVELVDQYDLELDEATVELLTMRIREEIHTQAARKRAQALSEQASEAKRGRIRRQLEQVRQQAPQIAAEAQKRFATDAERFDIELEAHEKKE